MKAQPSKIRIFFLLSLPFLLFAFVVTSVAIRHGREMSFFMGVPYSIWNFPFDVVISVAAFVICFGMEIVVLWWSISAYARKTREFEELNLSGEQGAKMLVRRDLELSRANERLRKLDEVKSNFISVVAHQLRTPLSGIKWTLNLLTNEDLGVLKTEQKTFLLKAYESNERMISLVNDLLGADRVESGKLRYQFQPVPIGDVVDSVLFELFPQAKLKKITIRFVERAENLPKVHADAEKLRAVMQNLLDNAVKYSREGGHIDVGFRADSKEMLISIKDDGIGIPKEEQVHVFERFFRAQNAIKTQAGGTGLGLYIVKSMIEQQGGTIWFESENEGGTTFFITIPISDGKSDMDTGTRKGV